MRLLVSRAAYEQHGAYLATVGDLDFVIAGPGGTLSGPDGRPWPDGAEVDIAWATQDLFLSGDYAAFFALVEGAPALQWFQSPGAGTDGPFFEGLLTRGVRLTTSHVTSIPIAEFVVRSVL